MNVNRFVSVAAAIVISAIQWAAFLNPTLHTQSMRAVGDPVAGDASPGSLPVVVVKAHRRHRMLA